jgi:hypothetical protein
MKPLIKRILRESDWLDDLSNQFSGVDLPFEVAKNPMNRPAKSNLFVMKTGWEYGDAYLREEFVFNMEDPSSFETFVNVCKFYLVLLDERGYGRWKEVSTLAKSVGLALGSYDSENVYGTPKDMSDFVFGSDYPAALDNVEISYFDKGGVEYDVRLKEPD